MDNNIFSKVYRKKTLNRINKKCKLLGDTKIKPISFMNVRVIGTIIIFLLFLLFNEKGYIYGPLYGVIFYIGLEYYLDYKIKVRSEILNYEAIFFFQVLVLTLESGKNLQGGIELTVNSIDNEVSREFEKTLNELKLGKSLNEALISMKSRIPSEEINTVLLNIREASLFGNNVIDSLNNQIEYLRDKKMLSIRAKINKMPIKISVISVVFIVPMVLLLILGPVLINFLIGS